jgi:hypothetical protein
MNDPDAHELTQLLATWSDGEAEALERLAPLVHAEVYRLAKRYMSRDCCELFVRDESVREAERIWW